MTSSWIRTLSLPVLIRCRVYIRGHFKVHVSRALTLVHAIHLAPSGFLVRNFQEWPHKTVCLENRSRWIGRFYFSRFHSRFNYHWNCDREYRSNGRCLSVLRRDIDPFSRMLGQYPLSLFVSLSLYFATKRTRPSILDNETVRHADRSNSTRSSRGTI